MIALFDFDGVVMDTETQYSAFWDRRGKELLDIDNFAITIKGQTLVQIFAKYFDGQTELQEEITAQINDLEKNMRYDYISGAYEFMKNLKAAGVPMAIVTSSNEVKMGNVRKAHPELWDLVDVVLTSEHFSKSKPDPECFLKGMSALGGKPSETYVFEDSLHGINAGRSSGAHVIGLATTLPREVIAPICEQIIDNFLGFSLIPL